MDITLQDGTKWQDGQPLTTDDIVYTYELAKSQSDISYSTLYTYITSITATGDRSLEIKLNPDSLNPGFVKNFLTTIRILPKHIWQPREASGKLSSVVARPRSAPAPTSCSTSPRSASRSCATTTTGARASSAVCPHPSTWSTRSSRVLTTATWRSRTARST